MIGERVKAIRKELSENGQKMTQEGLGKRMGVTRSVIANIEYGRVEPTDLFINHFCETFGVSETWLRTGAGDMYSFSGPDAEFDMICTQIQLSDDSFIKNALRAYWHLEDKEKAVIRKLINDLAAESK